MSDQVQFDIGGEFQDRNYKSSFARSVAVNTQFKNSKSLDYKPAGTDEGKSPDVQKTSFVDTRAYTPESHDVLRIRKNSRNCHEDSRLFSCNINSTRRSSLCSSRIPEIPVENIISQSKIETLQWQMKEIQKSREMYRAVMKQVVTFLEKAHHSLELLGNRMNRRNSSQKSRSENHVMLESTRRQNDSTLPLDKTLEDHSFKDFTWKQNKEEDQPSPEEIPPDKLAQEAFRLLRTAQSLLNTREPDLVQVVGQPEGDVEFLAQIAKEFSTPKPQRATSFSLSPKLILPENEPKMSTAFNRKLSLQLGEFRRTSKSPKNVDSARGSVAESDVDFTNEPSIFTTVKSKSEKSSSPANGSISSVEDESGFSSMNSFQEVGLPLINSTMTEEVSTKKALLRSMLQNNTDYHLLNSSVGNGTGNALIFNNSCQSPDKDTKKNAEDAKIWQKPAVPPASHHKRWYSMPAEDADSQSLKVLWV